MGDGRMLDSICKDLKPFDQLNQFMSHFFDGVTVLQLALEVADVNEVRSRELLMNSFWLKRR